MSCAEDGLAWNHAVSFEAQVWIRRYEPLAKTQVVNQQDFNTTIADLRNAEVATHSAQADLEIARLNFGCASVAALISGCIGRALVTKGTLVGQGEVTPTVYIRQLDSTYADFT